MTCRSARELLPLYFDGELDRADSRAFEAHLDGCEDCRDALIELDGLRRAIRTELPRVPAPHALRERIEAQVRRRPRRTRMPHARWLALAASLTVAFVAGGLLLPMGPLQRGAADPTERDVFAGHWRALAATSPVDVVSTDRHTVKPWFAGKVAQAPLVQDFAEQGFALVGGRLDYVGSERVPVLVYRHGAHLIDVFVLGPSAPSLRPAQRDGYLLDTTTLGDARAAIVSDMDAGASARFATLLRDLK